MSRQLIITILAPFLIAAVGDELISELSEDISDEGARNLAENLAMGSLANHVVVKASGKDGIDFITRYDCECFGLPLKEKAVALSFLCSGPARDRIALGDAIRNGSASGKFSVKIVDEDTEETDAATLKAAASKSANPGGGVPPPPGA